ncbi:serine O-acetyltransferase [Ruminococcaceae bacterium YRB3002]|nr:serine O-acetyltransferase [Ruminococcaceae bacterium YRB3002]
MGDNDLNSSVKQVVNDILDDYRKGRTIDDSRNYVHPDKEAVTDILDKLKNIVFAGYFNSSYYRSYTLENKISMLVEDVTYNLSKEIAKVLLYEENNRDKRMHEVRTRADEMALEFMRKIPTIREYINTDVEATYEGDPASASTDEIIFSYPGLYAIFVYRVAHELFLMNVPLIPRMMTEHAHSLTGIDIHPGATIGKYFFIDHGTGIVVGETTVIGEHVKLYQGVTLGALSTRGGQSLRGTRRHPTIEDNVTIYSNASILGGDTVIGKGVTIGGNAFITKSVLSNKKD